MTIEAYHNKLIEHLGKSQTLFSINRASPREWVENSYSSYKNFLINCIKKENKKIYRMTVVNAENIDEVKYFDDTFANTIKSLKEIGLSTKSFVDFFLNEHITDKFSKEFNKLFMELHQTNFDLLQLFLQIHHPKEKAIFVSNTFDNEYADLLGAQQKEILIYDHIALKVKHNKITKTYTIDETIIAPNEIANLRTKWETVYKKVLTRKTKGILLQDFLKNLEKNDRTSFSLERYNEDYKNYFAESPPIVPEVNREKLTI